MDRGERQDRVPMQLPDAWLAAAEGEQEGDMSLFDAFAYLTCWTHPYARKGVIARDQLARIAARGQSQPGE
jgi:hypothetical protein